VFAAAGFVHVIDDETKWDANFGRSVLAGLLGLGANVGQASSFFMLSTMSADHKATSSKGLKSKSCRRQPLAQRASGGIRHHVASSDLSV
jgi:predicted transcriptional regulator